MLFSVCKNKNWEGQVGIDILSNHLLISVVLRLLQFVDIEMMFLFYFKINIRNFCLVAILSLCILANWFTLFLPITFRVLVTHETHHSSTSPGCKFS